MSLTSLPRFSFNTIATYALMVCGIEGIFRKWAIQGFGDGSKWGKTILHGLDISQYVLGAAYCLSSDHQSPSSVTTKVNIVLFLPIPLICKAIYQWTDPKSQDHKIMVDAFVQTARVVAKLAFLLASIQALSHAKPRSIALLIGSSKIAILAVAFLSDTLKTFQYSLINQNTRSFYLFLKWNAPLALG